MEPDRPATARQCPFCCEAIHPAARKCPHCQEYLDPGLARQAGGGRPTSALAIASFVLGLVSPLLLCIPAPLAVGLGVAALVRRKRAGGAGMAVAGLVLGVVWTVLLAVLLSGLLRGMLALPLDGPGARSPAEPLF